MNDINPNDVDRALAAFGAQPMSYRSFEKHRLPAAAHVTALVALDDTAYDPFAPQPVMHPLDERLPDVLLPAAAPVMARAPARDGEPMVPAPPAVELPPMAGMALVHGSGAGNAVAAVTMRTASPVPAPRPVMPAFPSRPGTAAPTVSTQHAAWPSSGLSLPTLGAKLAAREKPRMEVLDHNVAARSLHDMFQVLNGRPSAAVPRRV